MKTSIGQTITFVASVLRQAGEDSGPRSEGKLDFDTVMGIAEDFADYFVEASPKFNRTAFIQAVRGFEERG